MIWQGMVGNRVFWPARTTFSGLEDVEPLPGEVESEVMAKVHEVLDSLSQRPRPSAGQVVWSLSRAEAAVAVVAHADKASAIEWFVQLCNPMQSHTCSKSPATSLESDKDLCYPSGTVPAKPNDWKDRFEPQTVTV